MSFLIGLLTVILVLNCVLLILLVLIQLPKKEAGAGLAFGGAATDALFGAGSGNVLTKVTKYATIGFFALAMLLAVMQSRYYHRSGAEFKRQVETVTKQQSAPAPIAPPPAAATAPTASNVLTSSALLATNAVEAPVTNAPQK